MPSRSSASPRPPRRTSVFVAARQGERDDPRSEQLPEAADDEIEQPVEIGLGGERVPDLFQRLELARPAGRRLVEPRVLDRDRGLAGEQRDELLVLLGEVLAALLLGQVEVAVGDAAQQDRARRGSSASADAPAGSRPSADPRPGRAAAAGSPRGSARRGCRVRAAASRSPRAVSSSMPCVMNCSSSEPLASITPSAA